MRYIESYIKRIIRTARRWRKKIFRKSSSATARLILAGAVTGILLFSVWISDRLPFTFGNEAMTVKAVHMISMAAGNVDSGIPEGYLPVNVCYDRQLADVNDEFGFPMGTTDIADREKLARFLELLEGTQYSAIGIDILFDPDITTESDSMLFDRINKMDRIAVAASPADTPPSQIDASLMAESAYSVNIYENGFAKYPFTRIGKDSFALRLFRLAGGDIDFSSPLNQPHIFLNLRYPMQTRYSSDNDKNWYNLGSDILDIYDKEEIRDLVKGKTIVIGDYEDSDMHDAYQGPVSGPAIIINAVESLKRGDTRIRWWPAIALALLFLTASLCLAFGISADSIFRRMHPMLGFVVNLLGFSTVLLLFEYILGLTAGEFHDMMWPVLILSLFSSFCGQLNKEYPLKPFTKKSISQK